MATPEALLLDIDGVLTVSWEPLPGAASAVVELRAFGVPVRFCTNTTSRPRGEIAAALERAGITVEVDEILTAPAAAAAHVRAHHPGARCWLLSSGDVRADLEGLSLVGDAEPADVVILGGAGPEFTYERLNHAFRLLLDGAALVAMHRNLYWRTADGLDLDTGAYLAGLEHATEAVATLVGKPSAAFYAAAVASVGVPTASTVMVGDDLDADVLGAQAQGLTGILVRTGKFRASLLDALDPEGPQPDVVLDSIADVGSWLRSQR